MPFLLINLGFFLWKVLMVIELKSRWFFGAQVKEEAYWNQWIKIFNKSFELVFSSRTKSAAALRTTFIVKG